MASISLPSFVRVACALVALLRIRRIGMQNRTIEVTKITKPPTAPILPMISLLNPPLEFNPPLDGFNPTLDEFNPPLEVCVEAYDDLDVGVVVRVTESVGGDVLDGQGNAPT